MAAVGRVSGGTQTTRTVLPLQHVLVADPMEPEEPPMRNLILVGAALLAGSGFAMAQQQPQAPETTGRASTFEERWVGERGTPTGRPAATSPQADAPSPATTGQAPRKETAPADPGNGNWDPPPATAPTTQR
jgi:hypothetical protein